MLRDILTFIKSLLMRFLCCHRFLQGEYKYISTIYYRAIKLCSFSPASTVTGSKVESVENNYNTVDVRLSHYLNGKYFTNSLRSVIQSGRRTQISNISTLLSECNLSQMYHDITRYRQRINQALLTKNEDDFINSNILLQVFIDMYKIQDIYCNLSRGLNIKVIYIKNFLVWHIIRDMRNLFIHSPLLMKKEKEIYCYEYKIDNIKINDVSWLFTLSLQKTHFFHDDQRYGGQNKASFKNNLKDTILNNSKLITFLEEYLFHNQDKVYLDLYEISEAFFHTCKLVEDIVVDLYYASNPRAVIHKVVQHADCAQEIDSGVYI